MDQNQQEEKVTEVKENAQPLEIQTSPPAELSKEQIDWRRFREVREIERKQKEESDKIAKQRTAEAEALKLALDAVLNKPSQNTQQSYEDPSEEDRIKALVEARMNEREQMHERLRQQKELEEMPRKLASVYNDFEQVCTQENYDYMDFHHPEVARSLSMRPEGFDKWSDVYKAIKRYIPNTHSNKEESRAQKNFNKPQSMSTPGQTQVGDTAPIKLDDQRRKDNWSRMQRTMRGA